MILHEAVDHGLEGDQSRRGEHPNLTLLAGDVLQLELADTFDVVVMPDVIEHIPLESHPLLFSRAANWLSPLTSSTTWFRASSAATRIASKTLGNFSTAAPIGGAGR